LHVLELSKLETALEDEPALKLWGKFLSATTDDQLAELAMEHPLLKRAKDALEDLSSDPEARVLAERRETALRLHRHDIGASWQQGKAEGRAEGKAEGRTEGKAEALERLLALRFGPVSADVTARVRSGSETELDHWLEAVLSAERVDAVFAAER
jgi:flagellar biosynthesis/type III secretory pathway protein FliH